MKYLFEVGDEVCYNGVAGIVLDIVGEYMPYQVELQDGSGIVWLREEDLAELVNVNDAGENTECTIDDTLEQRGKRYGTFKGHSELSQRLSKSISTHAYLNGVSLSDVHTEALNMICHKIARIANGDPNYDDSWRDIAGYAQLVVKHLNGEDV